MRVNILTENVKNLSLPTDVPFDYQLLMDRLEGRFLAPRNKIQSLCRSGEIIRVKKGLYVPGIRPGEGPKVDSLVLSGLIYGPSYVSLETALSWHGLIPERVDEITCMTSKRAKVFRTPVGRFTYTPINEDAFPVGVRLEPGKGGSWYLAEPEKALCDRIAQVRGLEAMRDVPAVLEESLRIDPGDLDELRLPLVLEIASQYRRKNVAAFARWLDKIRSRSSST
jgi:hypothetical protein